MGELVQTAGKVIRLAARFDARLEKAGWFLEAAGVAFDIGEKVVRFNLNEDDLKALKARQACNFEFSDGTRRSLSRRH